MDDSTSIEDTAQVAEARVMVSAQVDCTNDQALVLLNERAKATGLRLQEVAVAVVSHRTAFH